MESTNNNARKVFGNGGDASKKKRTTHNSTLTSESDGSEFNIFAGGVPDLSEIQELTKGLKTSPMKNIKQPVSIGILGSQQISPSWSPMPRSHNASQSVSILEERHEEEHEAKKGKDVKAKQGKKKRPTGPGAATERANPSQTRQGLHQQRHRHGSSLKERLNDKVMAKQKSKMTLEDQRAASHLPMGRERKAEKIFYPSRYEGFESKEYNQVQELYKKQFHDNLKTNKVKIHSQLTELVYIQINDRINKDVAKGLPSIFEDNKIKWSQMLMKNKKFQRVFYDFTEQISSLLEHELSNSGDLVRDYLRYPHSVSRNQNSNTIPWLPKKPIASGKSTIMTVKEKAKAALVKIKQKSESKKKEQQFREEFENKLKGALKTGNLRNRVFKAIPEKRYKHPVFYDIEEKLGNIDKKMAELDHNNKDLKEETEDAENIMTQLQSSKQFGKNPGVAITQMMKKWGDEEILTDDDLKNYAKVLHKTAEQFEKELRAQESGMKMELQFKTEQFNARVAGIRQTTCFRMEALESALVETKLKYQRQANRAEMKLAEMESHLLNQQVSEDKVDKGLIQVDEVMHHLTIKQKDRDDDDRSSASGASISSMQFLKVLTNLKASIKSLQLEKIEMSSQITDLKFQINGSEAFEKKVQSDFRNSKELVLFYQIIVYDILKRTKLFGENSSATEQDKVLFQEIVQLNDERARVDAEEARTLIKPDHRKQLDRLSTYVEDVHEIMLSLNVQNIFSTYQLVIDAKTNLLTDLLQELRTIGIIGGNKGKLHKKGKNMDRKESVESFSAEHEQFLNMLTAAPLGLNPEQKNLLTIMADKLLAPTVEETIQIIQEQQMEDLENMEIVDEMLSTDGEPSKISTLNAELKRIVSNSRLSMADKRDNNYSSDSQVERVKTLKEKLLSAVTQKQTQRLVVQKKREKQEAREAVKEAVKEQKRQMRQISKEPASSRAGVRGQDNGSAISRNKRGTGRSLEPKSPTKRTGGGLGGALRSTERGTERNSSIDVDGETVEVDRETKDEESQRSASPAPTPSENVTPRGKKRSKTQAPAKANRKLKNDKSKNISQKRSGDVKNHKTSGDLKNQKTSGDIKKKATKKGRNDITSRVKVKKQNVNSDSSKVLIPGQTRSGPLNGDDYDDDDAFDTDSMETQPLDHFKGVMEDFENKIVGRYTDQLGVVNDLNDHTLKLNVKNFEDLYGTFTQSLGTELSSKDYINMFENMNFEQFILNVNKYQKQYLERKEPPPDDLADQYLKGGDNATPSQLNPNPSGSVNKSGNISKQDEASRPASQEKQKQEGDPYAGIPFTDCIMTEIDHAGNLYGFHLRPEIMKVVYWKDEFKIQNVSKLIKIVNYMNRMVLQPENEFLLGKKKEGAQKANKGAQTTFTPEIQYVEKQVYLDEPDPDVWRKIDHQESQEIIEAKQALEEKKAEQKSVQNRKKQKEKDPDGDKSQTLKDFVTVIRNHVIDILQRENPDRKGYYKLVWEKQSIDGLLTYKLPGVFDEVPKGGFEEDERPETEYTVTEYLAELFRMIDEKLQVVIPRHAKKDLSLHDLVWAGDGMKSDIDDIEQYMKEFATTAVQTDTVKPEMQKMKTEEVIEVAIKEQKRREVNLAKNMAVTMTLHTGTQTPKELLPQVVVKTEVPVFNDTTIEKQIDRAMGKEMQKTIDSLNEFVDKVKLANSVEARREKFVSSSIFNGKKQKEIDEYSRRSNIGRTEKMKAIRDDLRQVMKDGLLDYSTGGLNKNSKYLDSVGGGKRRFDSPPELNKRGLLSPHERGPNSPESTRSAANSARQIDYQKTKGNSPVSLQMAQAKLPRLKTFIRDGPIREPQNSYTPGGTTPKSNSNPFKQNGFTKMDNSSTELHVRHGKSNRKRAHNVQPFRSTTTSQHPGLITVKVDQSEMGGTMTNDFESVVTHSLAEGVDQDQVRKSSFFTSEAPTANTQAEDLFGGTSTFYTAIKQNAKPTLISPLNSIKNKEHHQQRNQSQLPFQSTKYRRTHMEAAAFLRVSNDKAKKVKESNLVGMSIKDESKVKIGYANITQNSSPGELSYVHSKKGSLPVQPSSKVIGTGGRPTKITDDSTHSNSHYYQSRNILLKDNSQMNTKTSLGRGSL